MISRETSFCQKHLNEITPTIDLLEAELKELTEELNRDPNYVIARNFKKLDVAERQTKLTDVDFAKKLVAAETKIKDDSTYKKFELKFKKFEFLLKLRRKISTIQSNISSSGDNLTNSFGRMFSAVKTAYDLSSVDALVDPLAASIKDLSDFVGAIEKDDPVRKGAFSRVDKILKHINEDLDKMMNRSESGSGLRR